MELGGSGCSRRTLEHRKDDSLRVQARELGIPYSRCVGGCLFFTSPLHLPADR
jgi:hypothetical protein